MLNCTAQGTKSSFDEFSSKFPMISFPFQISDSLAFNFWNPNELIPAEDVVLYSLIPCDDMLGYNLIADYASYNTPLTLQDYMCSRVGKFKMDDYIVLLYKAYTTYAGNGNPVIILVIFSIEGKKIDEKIVLWDLPQDGLFYYRDETLYIPSNSTIITKFIVREDGFLYKEFVPKKITERTTNYKISPVFRNAAP